nr:SMI1/KNR4 family protein [Anaerotruncus sp. 1XD42-93]
MQGFSARQSGKRPAQTVSNGCEYGFLDRIEQKFHVKIPAEVREHYLAYNGGYPEKPVFAGGDGEEYSVDWFIPVWDGKERPMEKTLGFLRADDGVIPDWLLPFAEEGGGNLCGRLHGQA